VRSRLLLLIAIPTVTALVLGSARITASLKTALTYQRAEERAAITSNVTALAQRLEDERDETVYYIALGANGGRLARQSRAPICGKVVTAGCIPAAAKAAANGEYRSLQGFYKLTDRSFAQVKSLAAQYPAAFSGVARQEVAAAVAQLDNLRYLRRAATGTSLAPLTVVQKYAGLIDGLVVVEQQTAQSTGDPVLAQDVEVLNLVSRMQEQASEQRAILAAALLRGSFAPGEAAALTAAQSSQASNQTNFNLSATPAQLQQWTNTVAGSFVDLAAAEELRAITFQAHGRPLASDPDTANDWYGNMSQAIDTKMGSVERGLASQAIIRADTLRSNALTAGIIAVLILIALVLLFAAVLGAALTRLRWRHHASRYIASLRLPAGRKGHREQLDDSQNFDQNSGRAVPRPAEGDSAINAERKTPTS
jgi:hypothetical protein